MKKLYFDPLENVEGRNPPPPLVLAQVRCLLEIAMPLSVSLVPVHGAVGS